MPSHSVNPLSIVISVFAHFFHLRQNLPSSWPYCIPPTYKYTASFSQPRVLRMITIRQHSPSIRCHYCPPFSTRISSSSSLRTLLFLNSPDIPLTRPCTPAPRSSGRFRHQILHSTTPGLPLKPPRLRLYALYNFSALCLYGIVSRRLVPIIVLSCMRGERSRASPHYLPASKII